MWFQYPGRVCCPADPDRFRRNLHLPKNWRHIGCRTWQQRTKRRPGLLQGSCVDSLSQVIRAKHRTKRMTCYKIQDQIDRSNCPSQNSRVRSPPWTRTQKSQISPMCPAVKSETGFCSTEWINRTRLFLSSSWVIPIPVSAFVWVS